MTDDRDSGAGIRPRGTAATLDRLEQLEREAERVVAFHKRLVCDDSDCLPDCHVPICNLRARLAGLGDTKEGTA